MECAPVVIVESVAGIVVAQMIALLVGLARHSVTRSATHSVMRLVTRLGTGSVNVVRRLFLDGACAPSCRRFCFSCDLAYLTCCQEVDHAWRCRVLG